MPYAEATQAGEAIRSPASTATTRKTMALRVTRPAFIEGMRAYKASQGVKDYDVNKQATRQEMRAYVCGQCHVEYYFKGPEKRLVYPWAKGLKVEEITGLLRRDRASATGPTRTPARRRSRRSIPSSRLWSQGIHARSGVACADCHMPSISKG